MLIQTREGGWGDSTWVECVTLDNPPAVVRDMLASKATTRRRLARSSDSNVRLSSAHVSVHAAARDRTAVPPPPTPEPPAA